ncbi:hypothetical protein DJ031_12250 [bacterium endosymbiont of Escarpia laminata]|nr:MAG: hypothetical protein DJ031_12250 [bacterium endosymbiont of Escarpia laminata]
MRSYVKSGMLTNSNTHQFHVTAQQKEREREMELSGYDWGLVFMVAALGLLMLVGFNMKK